MELREIKDVKILDCNPIIEGNIDLSFLNNYKTPIGFKELGTSESSVKSIISPNINIEIKRLKANNEIRNIYSKIHKINQIEDDFEKAQYIGSIFPKINAENLPKLLVQIVQELPNNPPIYNEEDIQIKVLIEIKKDIDKSN